MPAMSPRRRPLPAVAAVLLSSLALTHALAGVASAQAALGFVETFPGAVVGTWGDGGAVESNPGSGGTGGATDGYLRFSTPNLTQHNLGVRSSGPEYTGSWIVPGITQVRLWLNDVGTDDPLEMHFSVGKFTNLWQYNVGFLPPHNQWAEFVVDVSSPANWTRVVGATGTFAAALGEVEVVHIRHDHPPFVQSPDPLDGDVGLDRLLLTNGTASVPGATPPVPRALQLAAPTPNPSRDAVTFSLEVFEAGSVRLEIVDALGRRVRGAELAGAGPGPGPGPLTWTWDGRDEAGRPTPAGVYRVRAVGRSGGMSRGLVRVE